MMRLANKVALITGGGSGLGKETCLLFAKEGATVVAADYNENSAKATANEILKTGGNATYVAMDVSDRDEVETAVDSIIQQLDRIDILINNAGITGDNFLTKMPVDQFNRVIAVNLTGVFHVTQCVVPHMVNQQYGKIINASSVVALYGNPGQTAYVASKAAVIGMTKTWAKEFGRYGINVNAVAPGFTETPMTAAVPDKILETMKNKTPLKRLGQPSDIASAYLYLASDDASYVNGIVHSVDGGLVI